MENGHWPFFDQVTELFLMFKENRFKNLFTFNLKFLAYISFIFLDLYRIFLMHEYILFTTFYSCQVNRISKNYLNDFKMLNIKHTLEYFS